MLVEGSVFKLAASLDGFDNYFDPMPIRNRMDCPLARWTTIG